MMRSILVGLWGATSIVSSLKLAECDFDSEDLSIYALCDRTVISKCESPIESNRLDFVEACLVAGGCSEANAAAAAETIIEHCEFNIKDDSWRDLRKRQKNKPGTTATDAKTTAADAKTTDAQTTAAAASTTDSPASAAPSTTDPPSSAVASTTDSPPSTDTPSASSTPGSTTQTSASSAPSTATTSTASSLSSSTTGSTTLVCLTTSQMSTTWCVTTTNGASTGTSCLPTSTPVISCAPGLICQSLNAGETTCMVRQNNLTTSGLVVTIIFGTVLFAFFASLFGMCIKSRRTSRRQARQREVALNAGTKARNMRDVEASTSYNKGRLGSGSAAASDAHMPLMAAQGPAGGNGNSRDASTDYASVRPTAHRVPSGSYQDVVASRTPAVMPKLHPGLMGMDADEDDMGYRGARGGI